MNSNPQNEFSRSKIEQYQASSLDWNAEQYQASSLTNAEEYQASNVS